MQKFLSVEDVQAFTEIYKKLINKKVELECEIARKTGERIILDVEIAVMTRQMEELDNYEEGEVR